MIGLGVLAAAFVIGLPIAVIYLLVVQSSLQHSRIIALERKVQEPSTAIQTDEPVKSVKSMTRAVKTKPLASAASVVSSRQTEAKSDIVQKLKEPVAPPSGPKIVDRLFAWLSENWFYAVSAVSLALAGLFLVQYGMENGMLPPAARVSSAVAFGLLRVANTSIDDLAKQKIAQLHICRQYLRVLALFPYLLAQFCLRKCYTV